MGNLGACCSAGNKDGACCAGGGANRMDVGSAVGVGPVPSNELQGIDASPPPGLTSKQSIEPSSKREADSAAGGDSKSDYQYVTYEDESTYTGQLDTVGKRHGHGQWQSRTAQYEGQWQDDKQHGKGRQTWTDGRVYDGQFALGKFAGTGRMVWHTQKGSLVYEGQYEDDLKHGWGKFVWGDRRTYDGEWRRGKRHGKGTYMNVQGEKKVGYWLEDKFDRWEQPSGGPD